MPTSNKQQKTASKVFVERFIERPVLAWVLNIVVFLLGIVVTFI